MSKEMSDKVWEEFEAEIRNDFVQSGGPEDTEFRELRWAVFISEVENRAANSGWEACTDDVDSHWFDFCEPNIRTFLEKRNPYRKEDGNE